MRVDGVSCMVIGAAIVAMASPARSAVDDRGNTAFQGDQTWNRAAAHMTPRLKLGDGPPRWVKPAKFEVGHEMSPNMPQSPFSAPFTFNPTGTTYIPGIGHGANGDFITGDIGQQGTQLDALGHFGYKPYPEAETLYYGGLPQSEVVGENGLMRLGVETAEPIITTVVLLDAQYFLNGGEPLPAGYAISAAEIQYMMAAQGLNSRGLLPGDAVFVHTGWGLKWYTEPEVYYTQGPGLAYDGAVYLSSHDISVVGLDNPFTDAAAWIDGIGPFPPPEGFADAQGWLPYGIHHHNLVEAGVLQIQNLYLTDLANAQVYVGAVFILPIRIKGGAGSPIRPVVIGHPAN